MNKDPYSAASAMATSPAVTVHAVDAAKEDGQ